MKNKIITAGLLLFLMTISIFSYSNEPMPLKKFYTITEDGVIIDAWCANKNGMCIEE